MRVFLPFYVLLALQWKTDCALLAKTDQKIYNPTEGESIRIHITVNLSGSPITLQLTTGNGALYFANVSISANGSGIIPFSKIKTHDSGYYHLMYGGTQVGHFGIQVNYLSNISFYQLTKDTFMEYVKCEARGFPKPEINWIWSNDSCYNKGNYTEETTIYENLTDLSFVSSRLIRSNTLNQRLSGELICIASNGETRNRSLLLEDNNGITKHLSAVNVRSTGASVYLKVVPQSQDSTLLRFKVHLHSRLQQSVCVDQEYLLVYPQFKVHISDICKGTSYDLQVRFEKDYCPQVTTDVLYNDTIFLDYSDKIPGGTIASIALSALLTCILVVFCCNRIRAQKKKRIKDFEFLPNISASPSTWRDSFAASERASSVIELQDSVSVHINTPGQLSTPKRESLYVAASDVSSPKRESLYLVASDVSSQNRESVYLAASDATSPKRESLYLVARDVQTQQRSSIYNAKTRVETNVEKTRPDSHKIQIIRSDSDGDYAIPYTPPKDTRARSFESLDPSALYRQSSRSNSMFLMDGSGYAAAEFRPPGEHAVSFGPGTSRNRPVSLNTGQRQRAKRGDYVTMRKAVSTGDHLCLPNSPRRERARPKSHI